MHDIKLIRKDKDFFLKKLDQRNIDISLETLLDLDIKNRELIKNKEKFEQEKKTISKKKDKSLFAKSKKISKEIEKLDNSQIKIKEKIDSILGLLPNIALDDVPVGKDESSNKEIMKVGQIPNFEFNPLSHYEIGKKLDLMDFDMASKVSGSRFVFLKGSLALLERAISNFMLDIHIKEFGYEHEKISAT